MHIVAHFQAHTHVHIYVYIYIHIYIYIYMYVYTHVCIRTSFLRPAAQVTPTHGTLAPGDSAALRYDAVASNSGPRLGFRV